MIKVKPKGNGGKKETFVSKKAREVTPIETVVTYRQVDGALRRVGRPRGPETVKISLAVPPGLLKRVDGVRGDRTRTETIWALLEKGLGR